MKLKKFPFIFKTFTASCMPEILGDELIFIPHQWSKTLRYSRIVRGKVVSESNYGAVHLLAQIVKNCWYKTNSYIQLDATKSIVYSSIEKLSKAINTPTIIIRTQLNFLVSEGIIDVEVPKTDSEILTILLNFNVINTL